ncbi:LysR substrate-binding domain-containing protein [Oceanobacter mangrovi]|uniref:LysR substrate-binding domain-containing protein n=1 Tax=Oceanobacter mangrovi TaxID=2862510 RepID=UPI001C8D0B03|nr:LysR substrate-binding domain-containing protein [Oceanobacter mangrovi]
MANKYYDLPSMHGLVCFEAAARHQGFKSAAEELNVTPAAISHQVKQLETDLGRELFRRLPRGVELTEAGNYLLITLQSSFATISDAISYLRVVKGQSQVTICATNAVSSLWLTPKISAFWRKYPQINVSQIVTDADVPKFRWDLNICYGNAEEETMPCKVLFRDRIIALGSPEFKQEYGIDTLASLKNAPLIHLDSESASWTTWKDWFWAQHMDMPNKGSFRVNNYIIALQAAEDGMGAVLGWESMVTKQLESGRLVQLVPEEMESPLDFYIRMNEKASGRARVLMDWLVASV